MRRKKTFVEKKIERLEKLSDDELLEVEKKLYTSSSVSSVIGLVVFIICIILFLILSSV